MDDANIRNMLPAWKDLLGLGHWDIRARFASMKELGSSQARVIFSLPWEKATVLVLRPEDYSSPPCSEEATQDVEQSIVHELLHIVFGPIMEDSDGDTMRDTLVEQALDRVARVLVSLKRGSVVGEVA